MPFARAALHDRRHNPGGHSIHNHFIIKALRLVQPGGLAAGVTSRYTMDARNPAARGEMASLADLVGAVRLPSGAHQKAAGTGVVTDLLILRRREPGRQPGPGRVGAGPPGRAGRASGPVNEHFLACPGAVLGELGAAGGAYNAADLVVTATPGVRLDEALTAALDTVVASARAGAHLVAPARGRRAGSDPRASLSGDGRLPASCAASSRPGAYRRRRSGSSTRQERPGHGPAVRRVPDRHVAVLVGSTEKMGVGTNVQDRAIALHHLDAPWRPADVAQREGRIIRQGNLNPEVQILRYVTEGSFDGYMWQTLERKARFIGQVMRGRLDAREIGDIGDTALSFSEARPSQPATRC